MKKISIIVAAYNLEKYISRALDSLIHQTYKNIEVIVVDDGSTDGTGRICDEYAKQDERIRVFHNPNGGVSAAKNCGLDHSSGEFIAFLDGDDWYEEDFLEVSMNNLHRENADISILGYFHIWANGNRKCMSQNGVYEIFEGDRILQELFAQKKFECMVCTNIYRAEIFCNIRFPVGRIFEDADIALDVFRKSNRVVYDGTPRYYYFQRDDSIVHSNFNANKLAILDSVEKMIRYSDEHDKKFDMETHAFYLKAALMLQFDIYNTKDTNNLEEINTLLYKKFVENKKYILFNPYIELRRQIVIWAIIIHISPQVLLKLWKLKGGFRR